MVDLRPCGGDEMLVNGYCPFCQHPVPYKMREDGSAAIFRCGHIFRNERVAQAECDHPACSL
jgi:hypothetical protein